MWLLEKVSEVYVRNLDVSCMHAKYVMQCCIQLTSSIWLKSLILDLKLIANLFRLAKQPVLQEEDIDPELLMLSDDKPESFEDAERNKDIRRGIDLATTLERIAKNFVITDPRLPDNPIVKFTNFSGIIILLNL